MDTISINRIPHLFNGCSEESVLTIDQQNDQTYALSIGEAADTEATFSLFKEIIGESRLRQIGLIPELGIIPSEIDQNTLILTKKVVRNIFIGLAHLKIDDLKDALDTEEAIDALQTMIPFASFEDFETAMMGEAPSLAEFHIDKARTSGKGLKGLTERVYLTMQHYFKVLKNNHAQMKFLCDVEFMTSRLADRELQEGNVLLLSDGCYSVDKVIAEGGAYVSILKDLEENNPPKIIFRGTAMRSNATQGWKSGANDVLLEIGMMGTRGIWPQLSSYLTENGIKSVEVWGKSLGGAFAQEAAILIEGILGIPVDRLVTYCSTGTGEEINKIFNKEILENRKTPFKMCVIRNGGDDTKNELDYIPYIGGVHIGEGADEEQCEIDLYYIHPKESEESELPQNPSVYHAMKQFIRSFSNAHCRQTTLDDFSWKKIDDREEINWNLRLGLQLETIRKCFAYVIHFLTLFLFNGNSFSSYFYAQRKLPHTERLEPKSEIFV